MKLVLVIIQDHTGDDSHWVSFLIVVIILFAAVLIFRGFLPDSLRDKLYGIFIPHEEPEQEQTGYKLVTEENNTPITVKKSQVTFLDRVLKFFTGLIFKEELIKPEPEKPEAEHMQETADDTFDQVYQFEHTAIHDRPVSADDDDEDDVWKFSHTEINQPK